MPQNRPTTAPELLRLILENEELDQRGLARKLDVPDSQISETLSGKRKINYRLAQQLYRNCGIDAEIIFNLGG